MHTKIAHEKTSVPSKRELFEVSHRLIIFHAEKNAFLLLHSADTSTSFAQKYGAWDFPEGDIEAKAVGDIQVDVPKFVGVFPAEYSGERVIVIGSLTSFLSGDIQLGVAYDEYRWVNAEGVESTEEYGEMVKYFVTLAMERLREDGYLNDVKRISADFENYKRRQEERMKELSSRCTERFSLEMIPILDNFRAAALHVPESEKENSWMTGLTYIGKQIEEMLERQGLVKFEAKEGEEFDPHRHEAVSREGEGNEGKIVRMLQPGYLIGTRVVRPAKVVTS
ncbi:MAG: nucleotide exchange factor GrpE [Candidatus Moraniibacteriota bacterium]|nr:MAG: nucleotide exchange factor GrpE [Candidatus Moranbacteria bacterium]